MEKLLEIKNLTKKYYEGTTENRVVDNVSMEVKKGEFVVIMGASGSGKTSLLHLIAGIDTCDEGTVKYSICPEGEGFGHMGEKAKAVFRRTNIGIVFQQQCLIPDLTVYENIMLPMMLVRRPTGEKSHVGHGRGQDFRASRKETIFNLCSQFGLQEHVSKYPSQLSGGQQQRVAILRSVINKPPILLCDEPTGSLNSAQTELVMDLLNELNRQGQTIILVTHDMKVAIRGERVVYIEDGRVEGELKFEKNEYEETEQERRNDREQKLMSFLGKRGW